jgi:hypothetical protein
MTCIRMELEVAHHFVIDASAEIQNLILKVATVKIHRGPAVQARQRPGHGALLVYVWCVLSCYESAGHNGGKAE